MITLFAALLLCLAFFYASVIVLFGVGFRRVLRRNPPPLKTPPFVSVVVPARNEEDTITACLQAILSGDYPPDRYEVVVVDDGSTDQTAARVRALQEEHRAVPAGSSPAPPSPRLHLVRISDDAGASSGHKHAALARGIAAARGDILLTTDADCTTSPQWISSMMRHMTRDTAFVSGPVLYRTGRSVFGDLQALESLGLVTLGAGAIGVNRPNLCNSANVAYRRSVYNRFASSPSPGDPPPAGSDEILIQRIASETNYEVAFCPHPEAAVLAETEPHLRSFLKQRRRWAATGARYPGLSLRLAIGAVYAFYLLLSISLPMLFAAPGFWPAVAAAFLLKTSSEAYLLIPACRHFDRQSLLRYFLPEQVLQLPYVVGVGLTSLFGPVHWKGRRIQ